MNGRSSVSSSNQTSKLKLQKKKSSRRKAIVNTCASSVEKFLLMAKH